MRHMRWAPQTNNKITACAPVHNEMAINFLCTHTHTKISGTKRASNKTVAFGPYHSRIDPSIYTLKLYAHNAQTSLIRIKDKRMRTKPHNAPQHHTAPITQAKKP